MASSSQGSGASGGRSHPLTELQVGHPICHCGLRARLYTSFRQRSLGRRFFGCPNYQRPNGGGTKGCGCGFFEWFDENQLTLSRATDCIREMRSRELRLMEENEDLRRQLKAAPVRNVWIFPLAVLLSLVLTQIINKFK